MKPGRKSTQPAVLAMRGTTRADRHATLTTIADVPDDRPKAPPYLSAAGQEVWAEEIARIVGAGAVECDSSMAGRYCEMEAAFRACVRAGEPPKAALCTELRRYSEMLGIAGPRSRLTKGGGSTPTAKASPFTIRAK